MYIKRSSLSNANSTSIIAIQNQSVLVDASNDDLILWPDGTFCYRSDLSGYTHMSDDYEVVPFGSMRYNQLVNL